MVLEEMRSQAEAYVQQFDGDPLLDQREINRYLDGPEASREEVYEAADELMDFYDELLGQDTTDVRDEFKDDIMYDMSMRELLVPEANMQTAKIFGSGLVLPALVAAIEPSAAGEALLGSAAVCERFNVKAKKHNADGHYSHFSGNIGVNEDRLPERQAYDTLASEMVHKYQHFFDSDTWMSMNRDEDIDPVADGFERAVKIKALENFAETEFKDLNWKELHDMRSASTAVNGYAQALSETGEVMESDLRELGLSDEKASEAVETVDSSSSRGYDLVAAALLAEENISGPQVYEDVFEGDFSSIPDSATH